MFKHLQSLIDGSVTIAKRAHLDCGAHFIAKGYKQIIPGQAEDEPRQLLARYYEQDNMFRLTPETLKQLRTVYKADGKFEVQFAASFFVVELDQYLVTYLDVIKTAERCQRQGLGAKFIADLAEFLKQQLEETPQLKGAHFLVGQSQILKPHDFFTTQGFGPLPEQFQGLKLDECDLCYRRITKTFEEVKESPIKRGQKVKDKFDDGKSDVSGITTKTNKTTGGKALDKHCPLCSFKLVPGADWARHCKRNHGQTEVQGVKCDLSCSRCGDEIEVSIAETAKTKHGGHKMSNCSKCGKDSEARRLTSGLCATCQKVKANTLIDVPIPNFLNAVALSRLSDQSQLMKPSDSFSMVRGKRRHELMLQELARFPIGDTQSDPEFNENEESQREHPNKRVANGTALALVTQATTHVKHMLMASHLDADAIKQLLYIEKSPLPDDFLSLKLQNLAAMLPQEAVANLMQGSQYPRVASLFPLILSRASQLRNDQRAGMLFTCVLFSGLHWPKAVAMLETLDDVTQNEVLQLFKAFIQRTHGEGVANWLFVNWKHVEPYHFELIKHLKSQPQPQVLEVLLFSLCVQVVEVPIFVEYAAYFAKTPASKVLVGYLKNYKRQPILTFNEFTALCSALMLEANIPVIKKCNEELMNSLLSDWVALLEKTAATVHLSDKGSIQEAIDEFIRAYGPIDATFSKDLFALGSSLGLLLHETPNKGNFKQLGLAHYVIGGSRKVQRQLWCVPSGDGKSRIIAFAALLGLKTGMFKKVHSVYANEHLMQRDKADFEDLWRLAECQDRVEHHIGHDFQAEQDSLILIDESDRSTFDHPEAFEAFIQDKFCVCLTATPSNCDEQGIEAETIKSLGFKQFDYTIGQLPESAASRLQFDEVSQASTLEQKVAVIGALLKQGSVLAYVPPDLVESLGILPEEAVIVDETIESSMLRQLDKPPYKLLIAKNSFAMRGIDYRSKSNPMFLVIGQQFPCVREALQGVARVGRFGDPCRKIKFADCLQLVDQHTQLEYNARLLRFVESRKTKVSVTAATAKKQSPRKLQPTQGVRMSQVRARGLLGQPPAGQLSLGKFFKPNPQ